MLFSGWQKLGKSWMMMDLAVEMAKQSNGKWVGLLPVKSGPVLYIDNESTLQLLKYRLSKLMHAKRITGLQHDIEFMVKERVKFTDQSDLEAITSKIEEIHPSVVIVDSFASCHDLEENASKDMRHFFDNIIGPITKKYNVSFIFVDHERKPDPKMHQAGGHRLRGSSAKGDATDVVMSMLRTKDQLLVEHANPRYGKPIPTFSVAITDLTKYSTVVECIGYVED